jgi:DNA-binding NtrC family response regulator
VAALQEPGYKTIAADNGKEALAVIHNVPGIDLLFTDIVMPDMSGRQLADAVFRIRPTIKVLYTTGYTRNAIVHNDVVDNDVSFLAKPFSIEALARKVREVLDAKEGRVRHKCCGTGIPITLESNAGEHYRTISTSSTHALYKATISETIKPKASQSSPPSRCPLKDKPARSKGTVAL